MDQVQSNKKSLDSKRKKSNAYQKDIKLPIGNFIMGANSTKRKCFSEDSEPLVAEIPKPVKLPVCQDEPDVIEPTELGDSMIGDGLLFCNLFVP